MTKLQIDGMRTDILDGFGHAGRNGVKRLIPGDALKLPFLALGIDPLHRILDPVGIVDDIKSRCAPGAQCSLVRRFLAAVVIDDLAIFHIGLGQVIHAAGIAAATDGWNGLVGIIRQAGLFLVGHGRYGLRAFHRIVTCLLIHDNFPGLSLLCARGRWLT